MPDLPTGTITFLFTDIEGSTIRWERHPEVMRAAVARHDELLRQVMASHGGVVFKTVGDAFYVAFSTAGEALVATIVAQQALFAEVWPEQVNPLRVRMALHTGEVEQRDNDYFGQTLNRVARILSSGHGGQVLLSQATAGLVRDSLLQGITLKDLEKHRLKDIQHPEHIFQLVIAGLPADFPPLKTLDRHPNNLPQNLTPLVGREEELAAVTSLLLDEEIRLVTLTGPGGTGKTRLSLQVAADVADNFPGGVYFVDLASIRDADRVAAVIAEAMHIRETGDRSVLEQLKDSLNGKVLLILDNFEQVVDAAAFVFDLLVTSSELKIVVTSRIALHLEGEHAYHVAPLPVPDLKSARDLTELSRYGSVALFVLHAKAVQPDFRLTKSNASAVVEICAKLDGLPLAIEMAAAHITMLPPQAMLKRLKSRLKLLTGGKRNRSARQQTLRGAIEWSYELLTEAEKTLFARLAVFVDGCTLEAIEAVCGEADEDDDLLDVLRSLIDKNLLRQQEQESEEPRFEMLSTIREYALELLIKVGKREELQRRHAQYYLELAELAVPSLTGNEQKLWITRLSKEYENMQAVLTWFLEQQDIEAGLRLVGALWRFWLMYGHLSIGRKWLDQYLTMKDARDVAGIIRAKALLGASGLARAQGDYQDASLRATEALAIGQELQNKEIISEANISLADVAIYHGNREQAITLLEGSLQIRRAIGDTRGIASLLNNLGNVLRQQGRLDQAAVLQEESLSLFRKVGDEWAIAAVLYSLGAVEYQRTNYEQAAILFEESLKLCRELGNTSGVALALASLGDVAQLRNEYERALALYKESLLLYYDIGDKVNMALSLERLAELAYIQKQPELSARLLAQAEVTGYSMVAPVLDFERTYDSTIEALREVLGSGPFEALWTTGRALTLEQAIEEVLQSSKEENGH